MSKLNNLTWSIRGMPDPQAPTVVERYGATAQLESSVPHGKV
jgi:hypothetical protein